VTDHPPLALSMMITFADDRRTDPGGHRVLAP
jgi:hypothetical protein